MASIEGRATPAMDGSPRNRAWIFEPELEHEIALYCFPPAGGGAATYRLWQRTLPSAVGVYRFQPPGRENRFREPFCSSFEDYVAAAASLIAERGNRPFALFGHSMGAVVAYETARAVRELTGREPMHLFVSAFRSPRTPHAEPIHELPDAELVAELQRRYDGIPAQVLANPEVLELTLPIVRSDLALLHSYTYRPGAIPGCPLTAIGGSDDPWVSPAELEDWRHFTTGPFATHRLPGGHFYLAPQAEALLRIVEQALLP